MMDQHLDFEQPIYTCLEKIEELKKAVPAPENLSEQLNQLQIEAEKENCKSRKKGKRCSETAMRATEEGGFGTIRKG